MLMSLRCALPLATGLLLVCCSAGPCNPPALKEKKATEKPPPQRTDRNGDPLPEGAIARLGTPRLVNPFAQTLAFLPDGKTLAVATGGTTGGTLRLWAIGSGRERRRFTPPVSEFFSPLISCFAISPDGKLFAAGCQNCVTYVWEADTGKELRQFEEKRAVVTTLAFSPDGKRLAVWSYPGPRPVRVWDVASGQCLATMENSSAAALLAFSADGKVLTASHRGPPDWNFLILTRWDAATGKELRRNKVKVDGKTMWGGCFSTDGRLLAHPTADGKVIRLIDTDTGQEVRRTEGEVFWPSSIAFSANGNWMTSSSPDGTIRVWETATGKVRHRIQVPRARFQRVALSHDGKLLAISVFGEEEIRLYDVPSGKPLHAFGGHRSGHLTVAFAPDGKTVVTVGHDGLKSQGNRDWAMWSLRRWDPASGKELGATHEDLGERADYNVFSPDGRLLATVIYDGTLRLWDVAAGKELRRWKVPVVSSRQFVGQKEIARTPPRPAIGVPVFSANSKLLFAPAEKTLHRWEVDTGKELPPVALGIKAWSLSCFATADPRMVLVAGSGTSRPSLALFDPDAGETVRQFSVVSVGQNYHEAVGVSPDGRTLVFQDGKDIRLLEMETGQERGKFTGGTVFVKTIAFSPDGRFLAVSGHRDNAIRVWQLPSGEPVRKLEGMAGCVTSLVFSSDSRRLVSAGHDNTALAWDVDGLFQPAPPATKWTPRGLETLWDALAGADAAGAYRAIWKLAESPRQSVPFLKDRLKAQPILDPGRIARLIADLDSNRFKVRQQATEELERLGPRAASALRKALQGQPTVETRMRLRRLLEQLEKPGAASLPSVELVGLRVLEALEQAGTAEARRALEEATHGTEERWASEAKAALERLARRGAVGK
jgi:WD40 repeat protein